MSSSKTKGKKAEGKNVPKKGCQVSDKTFSLVMPLIVEYLEMKDSKRDTEAKKFKKTSLETLAAGEYGDPAHESHCGYYTWIGSESEDERRKNLDHVSIMRGLKIGNILTP